MHLTVFKCQNFLPTELRILPVVGVVVLVAGRGVDVVSDQPVELLVGSDPDALHVLLGDVAAVGVEVAEDHHVLGGRRRQTGGTC